MSEVGKIPRIGRHIKPQQHWGWIIAIYLYLAGMGAGSFIIGMLIHWFKNPTKLISFPLFSISIDMAKGTLLWGPILVAIGAPFLILDLGIKRRFLYACLNPKTSWVARGFLILSAFILLGLLSLTISIFPSSGISGKGIKVLEILAFLLAFGTALYTGILLKSVKNVSLWNTHFLPLLFLISALSTGSMSLLMIILGFEKKILQGVFPYTWIKFLMGTEQILILIEGLILILYLYQRYHARDQGEQGERSVRLLLKGELKILFWGGIVLSGFVFPIILEYLFSHFSEETFLFWLAGTFLLIGGLLLRYGILSAGVKNQIPMERWMELQSLLKRLSLSEKG
ncbi:MAG: NrfD/PsrC family molybdoenzyme membrane anchor subunit [Thermodesulfobacteriota bacterium]